MPSTFSRDSRIIVFDVETTGLSIPAGDRIIEIGAVAIEGGSVIGEFASLISTEREIHWRARQVHGITPDMLTGQPPPGEVMPRFRDFIGGDVLCAHNSPFDMRFLRNEFSLLRMPLNNDCRCTLKLSRKQYPHLLNHRLETVARHVLGKSFKKTGLHRALHDARVTANMLIKMLHTTR